jgi:type II restriction enzyme
LKIEKRGWTLDVLNVVRSVGKIEFKLHEVYAHSEELAKLHPENHHVDEKIRQQLQELRDMGILKFVKPGFYRLL